MPPSRRLLVDLADGAAAPWLPDLRGLRGVEAAEIDEKHRLSVALADLSRAPAVLELLGARGQTFQHFATERADLEAIFLQLTGRKLRDA